jgi:hypothetical protein
LGIRDSQIRIRVKEGGSVSRNLINPFSDGTLRLAS